jgi:ArsR family transcriptional regulator
MEFEMRDLIKAFKALSDETRLRILNFLYDAGFLKLRRQGLWALYSIDTEGLKPHYTNLLEAVKKALKGNETALLDLQRLRSAKRIGPGCVLATSN